MNYTFNNLNKSIINCTKCKRLVKFRKKISTEKRKQYINETYWGKPITGFGDLNGKILFVGLAPVRLQSAKLSIYRCLPQSQLKCPLCCSLGLSDLGDLVSIEVPVRTSKLMDLRGSYTL